MNGRSNWCRAVLSGVLVATAAACSTEPIQLHSMSTPTLAARASTASACAIELGDVRDLRRNTDDLGVLVNRTVNSNDMLLWFSNGLRSRAAAPARIIVDADLLMMYVQGEVASKTVQIVAHLRYRRDRQVLLERNYRGKDTGMNWSGSESEVQDGFDAALNDLLRQMDHDLGSLCATIAVNGHPAAAMARPRIRYDRREAA